VYDWKARAANGYNPAKRSEDCLTTASLSGFFAQLQCSALTDGASWFLSELSPPQRALAAGRTCHLLLNLFFLSFLLIDLADCRHILYGFNALLLCNGRFWNGFTSVTSASLWPMISRDHS